MFKFGAKRKAVNSLTDHCEPNDHEFQVKENHTGVTVYQCRKCFLEDSKLIVPEDEFTRKYFGSIIGKTSYVWKKEWNTKDITSFKMSVGNFINFNFEFDGIKLVWYNRINGSRDGFRSFPSNFFDKQEIRLTRKQIKTIRKHLTDISAEKWATSPDIFRNLNACGFSLDEHFVCNLKSGYQFDYMSCGRVTDGFKRLANYLCLITDKPPAYGFNNNFPQMVKRVPKGYICSECGGFIEKDSKFCPFCGKATSNPKEFTDADYSSDETVTFCSFCDSTVRFVHKYCPQCGKNLRK